MQPPEIDRVADAMLANALESCARKLGIEREPALEALSRSDSGALGYFHYSLTIQLAEYLGALHDDIRAVYLYDDEATAEDLAFRDVNFPTLAHVIVWAARKTNALDAVIAAASRALADRYAGLAGLPGLRHLLNVQLVDDAEVNRRTGCAGLLDSVHFRPVKVWDHPGRANNPG
jgi:hypothetical protein